MNSVSELILASQSSFRKQLLDAAGVQVQTISAHIDEYSICADTPEKTALNRAVAKAQDVAKRFPRSLVIGADQVLSLAGKSLDKVTSREQAQERLELLSGKTHFLVNGLCLAMCIDRNSFAQIIHQENISVEIKFRSLRAKEISAYLDHSFEWQGVVGCYQYENLGIHLIERVSGNHSSIIGLPLIELLSAFRKINLNILESPTGPWLIQAAPP